MKILIIDNYDSFTFNLYQYIGEILKTKSKSFELIVKRNDEIKICDVEKIAPDKIIISPGPGDPRNSNYFGICADVLTNIGKRIPIFGVCLGMQGFAYYYGCSVIRSKLPMHGKTSIIKHNKKGIFKKLPQNLEVMRYHSLIVDARFVPTDLEIIARSIGTNEIMGLRHKKYPIEGVQFHPESFATEGGKKMIENFLYK